MNPKRSVDDLALFGGPPSCSSVKPTSNLVRPDKARFLAYSRPAISAREFSNGATVRQLEARLAQLHGTSFCVAFCSGFWSLAVAATVVADRPGGEMILPSLTYRRMADVASWARLKPHFCEVEPASLANSAATVRPCINADTALIVGVHPMVNVCDVEGLEILARETGVPLIFDSVESVHESLAGRRAGGFGSAEVFSIGASKLVNGFEGGYVTTNREDVARQLEEVRDGDVRRDGHPFPAINVRLNEFHAAMALAALDDLDDQVVRNRRRYALYEEFLAGVDGIRLVQFDEAFRPAYKNILVEILATWPISRDETVSLLNAERILARAYYDKPLHLRPMTYPHVAAALPTTEYLSRRYILLPCGHLVRDDDVATIAGALRFIREHGSQIERRLRGAARADHAQA
jgi:dTDP-4-amino-4,6-dideoxygalactose transaminase